MAVQHCVAGICARRVPAEHNVARIAAEASDIVTHPLKSNALIANAQILVLQGRRVREPEKGCAVTEETSLAGCYKNARWQSDHTSK